MRNALAFLTDVRNACTTLHEFTDGKGFSDYTGSAMMRSAVERQFEIIGDALNQAMKLDPSIEEKITSARRAVDFRNRLSHAYWGISHEVVWGVIENHLPILNEEITALIDGEDKPPLKPYVSPKARHA